MKAEIVSLEDDKTGSLIFFCKSEFVTSKFLQGMFNVDLVTGES